MVIKLAIQRNGDAPDALTTFDQLFDGPIISIGSDRAATLHLDAAGIAPEQAVIISEADQLLLINRADGTRLNDEVLAREARRPLTPGDRLRIGEYTVSLVPDQADAAEVDADDLAPVDAHATSGLFAGKAPHTDDAVPAPASPPLPPQSFAAILDSLRTEEDSFYFLIEGGAQSGLRVPIESAEMPLGWDEDGQSIRFDPTSVSATRAVIRKDWGGVVVQAQTTWMVTVNGEMVDSLRRLRNGDRLALAPVKKIPDQREPLLIFHEPASLIVLDSLLPQRLPAPEMLQLVAAPIVSSGNSGGGGGGGGDASLPAAVAAATTAAAAVMPVVRKTEESKASRLRRRILEPDRKYLGYYTLLDLLVFTGGTLAATLVVYLILHFTS